VEEDFYSILLDERLVLDTPCNSGHPMQCPLVTSLAPVKGRKTNPAAVVLLSALQKMTAGHPLR
jgi:hypothetical protein